MSDYTRARKVNCYSCLKPVRGVLYIEKEVNPDAYVPICEQCQPTWYIIKNLEKKKILEYNPTKRVSLTEKGLKISRLLKEYKNRE